MSAMDGYRYIPEGAECVEGGSCTAYYYGEGQYAIGYWGKRRKPEFHYNCRRPGAGERYAREWVAEMDRRAAAHAARLSERKAARDAYRHDYQPGDVLNTSWGYEQTNVEFYEVVAVTEKSVTLREVKQAIERTGDMQGRTRPRRGQYCGEPFTRRVLDGGGVWIDRQHVRYAHRWKGTALHFSEYA